MSSLILACIAFVGTHFLLSHPLRQPVAGRIGEGAFLGVYSLVAFATLGWMVAAYLAIPDQPALWTVGNGLWLVASLITLLAAILFVGSLIRNPAMPDPTGAQRVAPAPHSVFTITRHPMMWGFALWGIAHVLIFPEPAQIVLAATIVILALVGAAFQDMKKRRLQPEFWPQWQARTSYLPFARGAGAPGMVALVGGTALWLVATWAHLPLAGWDAGVWRWIS